MGDTIVVGWLANSLAWWITTVVNWMPVEITVIVLEATFITLMHRWVAGKWWWVKDKKRKDWSFTIDPDGWRLEGKGYNPVETISKIFKKIRGKDKTLNEEIKGMVKQSIRYNAKQGVAHVLQQKFSEGDSKDTFKKWIENIVDTEMGNANGKRNKKQHKHSK